MTTVRSVSFQRRCISTWMSARMPGSSAPNGSSSSRTLGLRSAPAPAPAAAACRPRARPDICPRGRRGRPRRAASRASSLRRAALGAEQPAEAARRLELAADHHVAEHRQMRKHRIALEHHAAVGVGLGLQRLAVERGWCRASAAPRRAACAGTWSCRSRRGRRGRRTARGSISRSICSSTIWSPYSFQTLSKTMALMPPSPARTRGRPCAAEAAGARSMRKASSVIQRRRERSRPSTDSGGRGRCGSRGRCRRRSLRPR